MQSTVNRIFHVVDKSNQQFIQKYMQFIHDHFEDNQNIFIDINSLTEKNKSMLGGKPSFLDSLVFFFKIRRGPIVFHSLFLPKKMIAALLFIRRMNCSWVVWGGDLYDKTNKLSLYKEFKYRIFKILRNSIARKCKYIITMVPGDYDFAVDKLKVGGRYLRVVNYPYSLTFNGPLSVGKCERYIQVGNSRDPSNEHLEILRILSNMDASGEKVFLPLAYGDALDYSEKVQNFSRSNFKPDNLFILDSPVELKQYNEILDGVGVAFFNHKRQQAVGNILLLLSKGVTIYIRSDISTWEFLKDHNLIVRDIAQFKQDKIINYLTHEERDQNMKNVRDSFSIERGIVTWQRVFNTLQRDIV